MPTPTVVGDGIDNDCDGLIDEELCTTENKNKGSLKIGQNGDLNFKYFFFYSFRLLEISLVTTM